MKFQEYLKILEREGFDDIDQPFEKDEPLEGSEYYFGEEDPDEVYARTKGNDDFHYDDDDDFDDDDDDDFESEEEEEEAIKRVEDWAAGVRSRAEERGIRDIDQVLKSYGTKHEEEEEEEEEIEMTPEEEEAYDNLGYTIRKMISGSKISNFEVYRDNYDFTIEFTLSKKERIGNILHIIGVLKKIASDVLIQYDTEVDLWETKKGAEPLFSCEFTYNPNKKEDKGGYLGDEDYGLPF
jgi:hypothetical protein